MFGKHWIRALYLTDVVQLCSIGSITLWKKMIRYGTGSLGDLVLPCVVVVWCYESDEDAAKGSSRMHRPSLRNVV